ncbi:hypothetical protein M5G07_07530 [Serratia symbiotica]|nr:hypothetical protein [Serratia symbiotica]
MHYGNLSFISSHGRPYHLAPAYDILPMGVRSQNGWSNCEHALTCITTESN